MDEQNKPNLPNPLTVSQIEAVRFQITKPGYSFEQVEAFIDKAKQTLQFIELEMRKDKLALAEGQDEVELLTERSQTLSATLEIFKVKGDAVVSADGEYLTESKVNSSRLVEENKHLKEQLRIAQEDANSGWEAEADLRSYIEQNLLPWLEQHKEAIVSAEGLSNRATKGEEDIIPLIPGEELESVTEANRGSLGMEQEPLLKAENLLAASLDEVSVEAEEYVESFSPIEIEYEEELSHTEHVAEKAESNPALGSDEEANWFK